MEHLRQPNNWTCMPTAFAMICGVTVEQFLKKIGHDGSAITWPEMSGPYSKRCFHLQECIDAAWNLGYMCMEIEVEPCLIGYEGAKPCKIFSNGNDRLLRYLLTTVGVIFCIPRKNSSSRHVCAWNGSKVLDPNGTVKDLCDYEIISYTVIKSFGKVDLPF